MENKHISKTIIKIEAYKSKEIEKALTKLSKEYDDARGCYNDTGYDRYYKKMEKTRREIDELNVYKNRENVIREALNDRKRNRAELEKIKSDLSSKLFYLLADFPDCTDVRNLKEYVENL